MNDALHCGVALAGLDLISGAIFALPCGRSSDRPQGNALLNKPFAESGLHAARATSLSEELNFLRRSPKLRKAR